MKSKKQVRRHRNKSKKFRKMKGAGGRFSMPMTTLTPQERHEALTTRAPTASDVAQQVLNTALLRMAGRVLQEQEGLHELAKLGSVTSDVIDRESAQRMKKDYMKSEAYLNKVKKDCKKIWDGLSRPELESIFKDFIIIYNNKRPEDSKLSTDPQNNLYLYWQFIKQPPAEYQKSIDEIYKLLVRGDIEDFEYMTTSPESAWAREAGLIIKRHFFDGIENELLFYESMLESFNNYNDYKNRNRGWGSLQGIVDRVRGGKRKTKKRKTKKRKTRKH